MALVIKAKLGDDVRRVEIEQTDFKTLKRTLRRLFSLVDTDFTIKYLDDEGDAVSLTCDKELQEALHFVVPANPRPFLRLTITPAAPLPTTPAAIPAPVSASPATPAAAPAPEARCPFQRRQQRQQQRQSQPAPFPALPLHLLRGIPLGAFAQQPRQEQSQQSCCNAINDVVSGLMAQPEIRQLAESFGFAPDSVPGHINELLRAFLPPQPEQPKQEDKQKEKEQQPTPAIPACLNDLFQNAELRKALSFCDVKLEDVAGELDSILRNVLPPELLEQLNAARTPANKPEEKEKETSEPTVVKHNAWCDRCNVLIEGVRYKCGMCSDYDLCESCEALTATDPSVHDPTHLFIKVRKSTYLGTFPLIRGVIQPGPGASHCRAGWRQQRRGRCGRWAQQQAQQAATGAGDDVTVVVDVIVEPEVLAAINKAKSGEQAQPEPVAEPEPVPQQPEPVSEPAPIAVPSSPVPTPKTETVVIEELDEQEKVIKVTPLVRLVPHPAPAAATPAPEPEPVAVPEPVVSEPKKEEYKYAAEAEQLAAMGFTDAIANRLALDQAGGNLIAAVNTLLG